MAPDDNAPARGVRIVSGMTIPRHAATILAFGLLFACSGSSGDTQSASAFSGRWECTGTATVGIDGRPPLNAPSHVFLTSTDDGDGLRLVRKETNNGSPPCTLAMSRDGETATFLPGQTCDELAQGGNLAGTYKVGFTGGGTIQGATLAMHHTGPLDGTGAVDGGAVTMHGTATVTDFCTRR